MPFVNWSLYVGIVVAVVFFGSSDRLAGAYGIAVTIDMLITTIMTFFVVRYGWKYPLVAGASPRPASSSSSTSSSSANIVKIVRRRLVPAR